MSLNNNLSKILIIDFGSQFTQLIARRVRELGVFSEIVSHKKIKITQIIKENIAGIILSGGPLNVYENDKFKFDKKILKLGVPILGICFGHQILSKLLGGKVKKSKYREFGLATINKVSNSILTKNFFNKNKTSDVWIAMLIKYQKCQEILKL